MAKRRPSGDGLVRKRSDGRWEGRIVVGHKENGTPIFKSVFSKTQKDLLKKLHQNIEMYKNVDLREDSNMELGEWLQKWLCAYVKPTVRENTFYSYSNLIQHHVSQKLKEKPLQSITTADIQKMYNAQRTSGRVHPDKNGSCALSNSYVRKLHMMLHEALETAVQEHLLPRNPTNGTTIPKNNVPPKQILTEKEIQIFLNATKEDMWWYEFFYTELTTGLRRGEICGLMWQDFDMQNGILKVRRTIFRKRGGEIAIGETKTGKGMREILLPPSTLQILKERRTRSISKWIFENRLCPECCLAPDVAYRKLKSILKASNLPNIRFHDLRHTFATHALSSGVDAKTLSGILGHTNASFTLDTYTHMTSDMQKNASNIVGEFMEDIFGKGLKPWQ